jgi:hypothetical protein
LLLVVFFFPHSWSFWNAEKKEGLQVLPVFISIDPERDTVEQIREYLKGELHEFNETFSSKPLSVCLLYI